MYGGDPRVALPYFTRYSENDNEFHPRYEFIRYTRG
jgi:hypothetical protein